MGWPGRSVAAFARELDRAHAPAWAALARTARPWPTGLVALDRLLGGGLFAGQLVVLAAAPGVGKTTLLVQLARHCAATGQPAVLLSFEHSLGELLLRLTCAEADGALDLATLRAALAATSGLSEVFAALPAASHAWTSLASYWTQLVVLEADATTLTPRVVDRLVQEAPAPALWLIDPLGLLAPDGPALEQDPGLAAAVAGRWLRRAARAAGVPLVAACQLQTVAAGRPPDLGDLEGGARLAHLADVVLLAWRPAPGRVALLLAKSRNSPAGARLDLVCDGPFRLTADAAAGCPGPA